MTVLLLNISLGQTSSWAQTATLNVTNGLTLTNLTCTPNYNIPYNTTCFEYYNVTGSVTVSWSITGSGWGNDLNLNWQGYWCLGGPTCANRVNGSIKIAPGNGSLSLSAWQMVGGVGANPVPYGVFDLPAEIPIDNSYPSNFYSWFNIPSNAAGFPLFYVCGTYTYANGTSQYICNLLSGNQIVNYVNINAGKIIPVCSAQCNFLATPITITATTGTGGTIIPSGTINVNSVGSKTFTVIPNPGYTFTNLTDNGAAVTLTNGNYTLSNVTTNHTIIASFTPIVLVDPVSALLLTFTYPYPNVFIESDNTPQGVNDLASKGTVVQGIASDGVAEIVLRIATQNVNDIVKLNLMDDSLPPLNTSDTNSYGALGATGNTSVSFSTQYVSAYSTSNGPMAFAVYRAPIDFPREGNIKDPGQASRTVNIQITDTNNSTSTIVPITIVRPPVVLIHGLWGRPNITWSKFAPFYSYSNGVPSSNPLFSINLAYYDQLVGPNIKKVNPWWYLPSSVPGTRANSLGFAYNAQTVQCQLKDFIKVFKAGKSVAGQETNPLKIPVAAVQADIVAHSMGGDITRTLPLISAYLKNNTFAQGIVHKVITIDTPHLGSPLANHLLNGFNICTDNILALAGQPSLNYVVLNNNQKISGGVGDLKGDFNGQALTLSPALININNRHAGVPSLPIAMIAAVTNMSNELSLANPFNLQEDIIKACKLDPLAKSMLPGGWDVFVYHSEGNDALVSIRSQLNVLVAPPEDSYSHGYIHDFGAKNLGYSDPSVLDDPIFPNKVIDLLNTPVYDDTKFKKTNP